MDTWLIVVVSAAATLVFVGSFLVIKAILIRNRKQRRLKLENFDDKLSDVYAQKLYELIRIKTTSYEEGEIYHQFREKVKELFPLVHQYFKKEKIGPNAILSYQSKNKDAKNVLIVTHIDTPKDHREPFIENNEVHGPGSFDSKALFFTVLQSVEEYLSLHQGMNIDLTIVMTVDDTSTKQGNEQIVNKFLRQGSFFHLVLEEGIGIIDPYFWKMRSHYALLGIGVTGEVVIRYALKKPANKSHLEEFVEEVASGEHFEYKIDSNSAKILKTFSNDMTFGNRILFGNPNLFSKPIKKKIKQDKTGIGALLKTHVNIGEYFENSDYYFIDLTFELASHDTTAEIVDRLYSVVRKYGLEYQLRSVKDPSKLTPTSIEGYEAVEDAVNRTYRELYVAPYIVNQYAEQRFLSRVSDCVIRFSPLYYPHQALIDARSQHEYVQKQSLVYGVKFFHNLFDIYKEK